MDESSRCAAELRSESDLLVSVGVGGSALGGKALCKVAPSVPVRFLEGTDPVALSAALTEIPWERTSLNIVSKSGGTLEALTNGALCLEALRRACPGTWKHKVAVTVSPGPGRLQGWARSEGVRILDIPPSVGGRFSVFTPVGLLPAAFAGLDVGAVVEGAAAGIAGSLGAPGTENAALALGLTLAEALGGGLEEVDIWGYGGTPHSVALWLQQIWAESLGRKTETGRVGVTPLACRGSEDQHSLLQLFTQGPRRRWILFLTGEGDGPEISPWAREFAGLPAGVTRLGQVQEALWKGTSETLRHAGVPSCRYHLGAAREREVGEALAVFIASTLWAAGLLGVDPFGQPGVEFGKRRTRSLLEPRHRPVSE